MQTVRSAARTLRRKGYAGPPVVVKNPHKYFNRWRSAI